ncbi:vacuolar protein sorting protein DigA [Aspergillus sclerotiicarbonarius CBS 121057]|uniref:Vacuolar protein sorting protein DigA n=1 Tax=Aspergillus sclerotiicarbonarius (strain CBS 121057 / IBT 28362) TaxID=1448318 RepID=A0A319EI78_ASPSB|nr:vacuolar protein sorting protein DigA [Aspergillus sclerotiicarbonarius CBS 121057]
MALETSSGYVAPSNLTEPPPDAALSMFDVRRVQLQFPLAADFVAAQVANNVLILALSTGRILRIDLDTPEDIDDIDLPKKSSETGVIRRMFLDPSASHLIITTTLGENYYLHTQSRQPKPLTRLKGVSIESVAWNPSLPTASTREILLGTTDGQIWEAYIEPSTEFYRREERYAHAVYKAPEASPVTGIWAEAIPSKPELRRVLIATHGQLLCFSGRTGRYGREGGSPIYADLFQREAPVLHEIQKPSSAAPSTLSISPIVPEGQNVSGQPENEFAWLSSQGIYHGQLPYSTQKLTQPFESSNMLPRSMFPASESSRGGKKLIQDPITAMTLSQWHILALVEGRVIAVNRMNEEIVYDEAVLEPGQSALGLLTDAMQHTYWLFTSQEIFEIAVEDEDRDVWKVFLQKQMFDEALQYARTTAQKDAVSTASGDFLASKGRYLEAANVWGKSSKGFEEVCLTLINRGEHDALRKYLLGQLSTYKKSSSMQRIMVASWLVEVFMTKLNSLDDNIATRAELAEGTSTEEVKDELGSVRAEFQEFVTKYRADLDKKTAYNLISSHGREEELLFFATAVNDHSYVLSYWIQREKWSEALNVLQRQSEPDVFYKYSSVLMTHAAAGLVDILMRQTNLEPEKLIPALLNYNKTVNVPLGQNQAVRYLNFIIVNHPKPSAAVHNTLISIHASSASSSEAGLLTYLQSQPSSPPPYDADFALRLCIQHQRVQSCVHIYSAMGQYLQAVELALQHDDIELAAIVADRPEGNDKLRKKLWLLVAEKKIRHPGTGIKDAIEFLKRCELLRIEDLIPFFPDFVVIDDFKDEICSALEEYSRHIDALRQEMDNSAHTARQIRTEIAALDTRYAIVEPGEKCWLCSLPVLSRQFFVFPCQHAFHSDCLGKEVLDGAGGKKKYIRDLQAQLNKGTVGASRREEIVRELDGLIAEACVLCGDHAIKQIDKPFVTEADGADEWAL